MNLCKRALLFYRLAATQMSLPFKEEEVAITDPEKIEYDKYVSNLPTLDVEDIVDGINKFYHKSYFDYNMFIKELSKQLFAWFNDPIMILNYTDRAIVIKENIKQIIIQDVLEFYLDNSDKKLTGSAYLSVFEKDYLSKRILRKAQHKIIQSIINMQKENKLVESMSLLNNLLKNSVKLDKSLLWKLAKHFGPEYYGELSNLPHGILKPVKIPDFNDKKVIDMYDVSEWLWSFRISSQRWNKNDFLKLLEKSNDEAKQYLRTFLYIGTDDKFILSEDMKPMNKNYQSIPFPDQFYIMYGWQDVEPIKKVWEPIFDEFKIIPYTID